VADEKFESGMTEQERQERLRSGVDPIKKGDGSGDNEGDSGSNPGGSSGGSSGKQGSGQSSHKT